MPRPTRKQVSGPLSETEGEGEEPDFNADAGDAGTAGGKPMMEKAFLELTKIAAKLTDSKEKKDGLEPC